MEQQPHNNPTAAALKKLRYVLSAVLAAAIIALDTSFHNVLLTLAAVPVCVGLYFLIKYMLSRKKQ